MSIDDSYGQANLYTNQENGEDWFNFFYYPNRKRIQLLEYIMKALTSRWDQQFSSVPTSTPFAENPPPLPINYPTIADHSRYWNLNWKQKLSFLIIAVAFLRNKTTAAKQKAFRSENLEQCTQLCEEIEKTAKNILGEKHQLLLYLGGSGGCGKSRVIHAVVDFCRRWNSTASVLVSATSGLAATFVGGCTIHSALGIHTSLNPPDPQPKHLIAWSEIDLVIIDEMSMMSAGFFGS